MSAKRLVVRYRFRDGSTADKDAREVALTLNRQREALQQGAEIEHAALVHADYEQRKARSELASEDRRQRRQKRGLDARDEQVRMRAAAEKKKRPYGYLQRTGQAFPGLTLDALKAIIYKKKKIG
jgi:hypothetical protein